MDSEDADDANRNDDGRTLLYVFERGYVLVYCIPRTEEHILDDAGYQWYHVLDVKYFLDLDLPFVMFLMLDYRDAFGESSISGDKRWAGSYGVNIDFVARSHCAVEIISVEDIQASA